MGHPQRDGGAAAAAGEHTVLYSEASRFEIETTIQFRVYTHTLS